MSKHKHRHHHSSSRQGKQSQFQKANSNGLPRSVLVAGIGLIVVLGIAAVYVTNSLSGSQASSIQTVSAAGQDVQIPLAELSNGQAKYYRYQLPSGEQVQFFAMKSSDGVYRAAFNSCDVCYQARRGYREEGDNMVCNKCGQTFPSQYINVVKGGCNPDPLERTVSGDYLTVRVSDLQAGAFYF